MPTRGLMSFQLFTRPVQPAFRLFLPSGQSEYVTAELNVPAGRVSGSVAPTN